jgi:hypothetical protein
MSSELVKSCEKVECLVGTGGVCADGLADVDECPHFLGKTDAPSQEPDDSQDGRDIGSSNNGMRDRVSLPGRDEYTFASASEVTLANLTRLVVIAGEADSGKTTLLASFIDRFQKGSFSGYRFAGCKTLMGFEQRCHLARLKSGGAKPDTGRTGHTDEHEHKLLHLTVRSIDRDHIIQDLLFTDISGENFRLVKDFVEEAQKLEFLHRADRFVLLVDGEKLASPTLREEAYQGAVLILRRCVETGILDQQSFVDVVFTKVDLIEATDQAFDTSDFLKRIEQRIKDRYEGNLSQLRYYTVGSRHLSNRSPRNQLADLFSSWVNETPIYHLRYFALTRLPIASNREFHRYLERRSCISLSV